MQFFPLSCFLTEPAICHFPYCAIRSCIYDMMGESNTVVSTYTMSRHLQQYCSHPSNYEM